MKYGFIAAHRGRWKVSRLCSALNVSRSGYYSWRGRGPSLRVGANAVLSSRLSLLFQRKRGRYGSPRLHALLRREGYSCSRNRVARLMQQAGLHAARRRRARRSKEAGLAAIYPNLLDQQFAAGGREALLVDLTYIRCLEGWCYLAVVLRMRSRRVIGHSMGRSPTSELCLAALEKALATSSVQHAIHHSDRGSTYTSRRYIDRLQQAGLTVSMSGKGNCYDNAVVESFFASLKREMLQGRMTMSFTELKHRVSHYIEEDYNQERMHSSLGYLSPVEYEKKLSCA